MQIVPQQQVEQRLLPVLIVPQHSCPMQGQQMAAATKTVFILSNVGKSSCCLCIFLPKHWQVVKLWDTKVPSNVRERVCVLVHK